MDVAFFADQPRSVKINMYIEHMCSTTGHLRKVDDQGVRRFIGKTQVVNIVANICVDFPSLGRGCRNRRRENLGIAKKGGEGLTYAKIFWWICRCIPKTLLRHHLTHNFGSFLSFLIFDVFHN